MQAPIETIAALGLVRASYAQIVRRAGISSTGLIFYHFASKDELIEQVVAEVSSAGQEFMRPRIEAASGARARLRAYIESNLEFMTAHRAHIVAVVQIFNTLPREPEGQSPSYAVRHKEGIARLEDQLRAGQATGELRSFSTHVMAVTIRAAIDAFAYEYSANPHLDVTAHARELAALFDRATRATTAVDPAPNPPAGSAPR